ncbi:hypothetical protein E2320_000195, partial [Naja naja]
MAKRMRMGPEATFTPTAAGLHTREVKNRSYHSSEESWQHPKVHIQTSLPHKARHQPQGKKIKGIQTFRRMKGGILKLQLLQDSFDRPYLIHCCLRPRQQQIWGLTLLQPKQLQTCQAQGSFSFQNLPRRSPQLISSE